MIPPASGKAPELHETDRELLDLLQREVPVTERPYSEIGSRIGISEKEVIDRLKNLKEKKIIRQISAIFDTRSLGYASSLVAAKIDPKYIEHAVEVINAHPGVSHNYLRNHEFNLWYTIAVSPLSELGLDATVDQLHRDSLAESTRLLPTLKLYKIGVRFDMGNKSSGKPAAYSEAKRKAPKQPLTDKEIAFVRAMQRDLELVADPFGAIAYELGISLQELQQMHGEFLATGRMRRFAAVLHHRKAGFSANAMGVWAGPQDDDKELNRIGQVMAGFDAVSHCYRRPTYADWPYNLFTMVHGRSPEDCEATLNAIADATGLQERMALYSSLEFKKVRVRYFTGEEAEWEAAHR